MSEKLFSRKNASRAGWAGAGVFGAYSVLETVLGNNEGPWTEIFAIVAALIGRFAAPKK